ncbi:hypothetical protein JCM33374_g2058 [Metschnikowia sp. JCM 33374]|nr:hypothetical protein JCM33374_g2058 [Metschnikowia sp. JCM 33374]
MHPIPTSFPKITEQKSQISSTDKIQKVRDHYLASKNSKNTNIPSIFPKMSDFNDAPRNSFSITEDVFKSGTRKSRIFDINKTAIDTYFGKLELDYHNSCEEFAKEIIYIERLELYVKYGIVPLADLSDDLRVKYFGYPIQERDPRILKVVQAFAEHLRENLNYSKLLVHRSLDRPEKWCSEWVTNVLGTRFLPYDNLVHTIFPSRQKLLKYFVSKAENFLFVVVDENIEKLKLRQKREFLKTEEFVKLQKEGHIKLQNEEYIKFKKEEHTKLKKEENVKSKKEYHITSKAKILSRKTSKSEMLHAQK